MYTILHKSQALVSNLFVVVTSVVGEFEGNEERGEIGAERAGWPGGRRGWYRGQGKRFG